MYHILGWEHAGDGLAPSVRVPAQRRAARRGPHAGFGDLTDQLRADGLLDDVEIAAALDPVNALGAATAFADRVVGTL